MLILGTLFLDPHVIMAFDGPFGPWNDKDVGDTGLSGSGGCSNGVFTITGSGADICCEADAFNYTYRTWTGDCGFIIRLNQIVGTNTFARAGIMFRATLDPVSPYAFVQFRAGQETAFQTRDTAGQAIRIDGTWTGTPNWLKLIRLGNTFSAYDSLSGTNWNLISSTNIDMPPDFLVGLAVTSHSYGIPSTATCDNLQVAATPPAPTNLRSFVVFHSIDLSWTDNSQTNKGSESKCGNRGMAWIIITTGRWARTLLITLIRGSRAPSGGWRRPEFLIRVHSEGRNPNIRSARPGAPALARR